MELKFEYLLICLLLFSIPFDSEQHQFDCTSHYNSQTYNFSSLALKPWNVSLLDSSPITHISFSLCNSTFATPCGVVGFCIIGKDNTVWSSSLSTSFGFTGENFKFSSVLSKKHPNVSETVTMEVRLKCSGKDGKPIFENYQDGELIIVWELTNVCNYKSLEAFKSCIFSGEKFGEINLQPLRRDSYYTIDTNQRLYFINLCGGTVSDLICGVSSHDGEHDDDIAICEIDHNGNNGKILGRVSKQKINKKDFIFEYHSSRKRKDSVKIKLQCNSSVNIGEMKFNNKTGIFELETNLVCISRLTDCFTEDQHLKYNLSALHGKDYIAYENNTQKYILSVCHSVKNSHCHGGVSVCLENGNSSLTLGTLSEGPEVENGLLKIYSSDGAVCNNGNSRYKTVIIFNCSKTDKNPKLLNVSSDCLYIFEWSTKAACPYTADIGTQCRVQDPVNGYDFDLKSLRKSSGDYIINLKNGEKFHLNVCGELIQACNGSKNVGVCLTDDKGVQYGIGEVAVSPHYYNGIVSFELAGVPCASENESSKVIIKFLCNWAKTGENYPQFSKKHNNCTYVFEWQTAVVCGEFPRKFIPKCQVSDENGEVYDLSPLTLNNHDYIIPDTRRNMERKFIINVCQPVVFGNVSRCHPRSGICLWDATEPNYQKSFINLGDASDLQYDSTTKALKLVYTSDLWLNGNVTETRSVIIFHCDREDKGSSKPILTKESGWMFEFLWKSNLACSKRNAPYQEERNCKAHNPITDERVDFDKIAGHEYTIKDSVGKNYRLTICGSLKNISGGICRETGKGCENLGNGNSNLYFEEGRLFLNYSNGVNCSDNSTKANTIIEFICDIKNNNKPLITTASQCTYYVTWPTDLACEIPCTTVGPRKKSLYFLSNNVNNYRTSVNGVDYFINICKPLVPVQGLKCYGGSSICKAVPQQGNGWSSATSLGFSHLRPFELDNKVVLNYSSNVYCENNTLQNFSSSIIFVCDLQIGLGVPELMQPVSDCHYEFIWKTNVVCDDYIVPLTDNKSPSILKNNQSKTFVDLVPLKRNTTIPTKFQKNLVVENFIISGCDNLVVCEVQRVRKQGVVSYGRAEYAVFNYSENKTQLFFSRGDECEAVLTEKYHASIDLLCMSSVMNLLYKVKETDCSVELAWKSNAACAQFSSVAAVNTSIAMSGVSKSSVSIPGVVSGVILTVIACVVLYCVKKTKNTNCCRRNINRIFKRQNQEYEYSLRNPDSYDFEGSSEELL